MGGDALLTDLYELHMLQSYHAQGMDGMAVFDFTVRALPERRNFLVAAGLEHVLDYLEDLHFSDEELAWLHETCRYPRDFIRFLAGLRFTGQVDALPEGTVFFGGTPVLRVSAPIAEAQLVESRIINLLQFSTMIASKAVRCVAAAAGRALVDFGLRRAHGAEAALLAARCSYLAGFAATATVLAGQRFGIPVAGTMAHSYIQAHDSEEAAFAAFARGRPEGCTLLVDTYDVPRALERVVRLAQQLRSSGAGHVGAVRIDSGDLAAQARLARAILDRGDCKEVRVAVSGDLDEYCIAALVAAQAPIDMFGVGTRLSTCADAPYLDCAYKLAEYRGAPRRKRSPGKQSYPGRKQVFRCVDGDGLILHDTVGLETELLDGRPLLQCVMRGGRRTGPRRTLPEIRQVLRAELAGLPQAMLALEAAAAPVVRVSPGLVRLAELVDRRIG